MPAVRLLVSVLVGVVLGCSKTQNEGERAAPVQPVLPAVVPEARNTPLTDADYRTFGEELERALSSGDGPAIRRALRPAVQFDRVTALLGWLPTTKPELYNALRSKWETEIVTELGSGVPARKHKFLGVRTVRGRASVVVRVTEPEDALNYFAVTLERDPESGVAAEDVLWFASGVRASQQLRWSVLTTLAQLDPRVAETVIGVDRLIARDADRITSATRDTRAGRHRDALEHLRGLPDVLRNVKVFALRAARVARECGREEYLCEAERLSFLFRDDPSAALVLLDYYYIQKRYDHLVQALDLVIAAVGGDPYLEAMRGLALYESGNGAEGRTASEKAIAEEPKLEFA